MKKKRGSPRDEYKAGQSIGRFVRAVKAHNSVGREKAARSILRSASGEIEPALIHLLKDGDSELRTAALGLLKEVDWDGANNVAALLNDEDPSLRIAGIEILTQRKCSEALPLLVAHLEDEDARVRNAACMGLGALKDTRGVDGLLRALGDEEWIAFSAIHSLGQTGTKRSTPHLWKVFTERDGALSLIACEVLLSYQDPDVSRDVVLAIKGWPEQKRDVYIRTILEKQDTQLLEELYRVLGDLLFGHLARFIVSLSQRSMQLMKILARFKRRESCDFLLDVLASSHADDDDFDELVRLLAGLRDVWLLHVEEYLHRDPAQLLPFIRACAIAGHTLPEERLDTIFQAAPLELKREIIRSLPRILDGQGGAVLSRALSDEDGHVKGDGALAAAQLGLSSLAPQISELARAGFVDVRTKALRALVLLDPALAAQLVQSFVQQGSSEDKKIALSVMDGLDEDQALAAMTSLLHDPDHTVLRSAIYAAGKLVDKDSRYLELLGSFLARKPLFHELLRVIREHKLDAFSDQLKQLFLDERLDTWTRYETLAALAAFRDRELFDVFIVGLRDENTLIKIGSIKALCDLSDTAAVPLVRPFVKSQDAALRSVAEAALEQLSRGKQEASR